MRTAFVKATEFDTPASERIHPKCDGYHGVRRR
jgi:hypothetical protein